MNDETQGFHTYDDAPPIEPPTQKANGRLILPPPSLPMDCAREYVALRCLHENAPTLRWWREGWWEWRQSHWFEISTNTVRSRLYEFTEHAAYVIKKKDVEIEVGWAPSRRKIADLIEALGAILILSDEFDQPSWLDQRNTGAIVATTNGLLDVMHRQLLPHTPKYFNQTFVPFDYVADAAEPEKWLSFLSELWPDEPEAIDVLGEWYGYVISGLLHLQKILLTVGPTRGGKGIIGRMLAALVGKQNACGPTLTGLGGEFGLQPLIGKPLAVVSDARFTGRNNSTVVERLLSISGEDTLTVNRENRAHWNGKLPTRLHIISNELPKLGDASGAIVGRFVLLQLSRSWLGKEDTELEDRLCTERQLVHHEPEIL
jgi:putative DNA primase/helicase